MINKQYKRSKDIEEEWDIYWNRSKDKVYERKLFDFVASFYRNYLIGPYLKKIISKHFKKKQKLLHAGSGGGEVDRFIIDDYNIKAIDISSNALKIYKSLYQNSEVQKVDLFDLSHIKEKYDGIYNLGVMEHFSETEIVQILKQLKLKLNRNGKIILFWPPVYGLSVIGLHIIHFVLKYLFRKKTKLHADEPNKVKSKKQLLRYCTDSNLKIINTYFGISDAFTYYVVVLKSAD